MKTHRKAKKALHLSIFSTLVSTMLLQSKNMIFIWHKINLNPNSASLISPGDAVA